MSLPASDARFTHACGKDTFYGDRSGTLEDPFGYQWTLATHKEDLTLEELRKRSQALHS
jgi:PhnB protein